MSAARRIAKLDALDETIGDAAAGDPLPLVITLHGRGGMPGLPSLAHVRRPVRVIAPFGPHAVAGAYAWSPLSVTSHRDAELAADLAASAAELEALITSARAERPIAGVPILAAYSQGAMTALALAARATWAFELVLGASWALPALELGLTSFAGRVRAAHGSADEIVPLSPTEALYARLADRGLDVVLRVFPGVTHEASPAMEEQLARWLGEAIDRVYSPPEVARVVDILLAPDVFVNASVAAGTPPEHIARRVLGKPGDKPKTTRWVMTWARALLGKAPGFKAEMVDAQMKTIESLCEVVEVQDKTPEGDWVKGLVASAKAAKLKRVVTDHPDLADKTEVDGIAFLSSEAWLVEQTTPPPPPPPKKSAAPPADKK